MAERDTVAIYVASKGFDTMVYSRPDDCLDAAKQLRRVVGPCSMSIHGDGRGETLAYRDPQPSLPTRSEPR